MKEEFYQFLKRKRIVRKFKKNLTKTEKTVDELVDRFVKRGCPENILWGAFLFCNTPEGFDYWEKFAWKWEERFES